ncbi:hypothetical protein Q4589_01890 [Cobetia marina]|uniref:hypothetical protein n=1 Tax=Cobetia marina TaxID=28258 RepID=UPI0026E2E364|nr:hypothetical protein [Cobetia marina]MDO6786334.1 hypothetical protein [Cobetia marina]
MKYANREWFYSYRKIFNVCSEKKMVSTVDKISKQYSGLTRNWTTSTNSEWTCRHYLATKMILNATVLTNALDFSSSVGMRIANPYFEYYATLSLLRALVYTIPSKSWDEGELISISHSKAINLAFDWLAKFDTATANKLKSLTLQLKSQREVISYRAPASGDSILSCSYDLFELLIILAEAAQLNSELLEASVKKNASHENFVVEYKHTQQISMLEVEGFTFCDREDSYRLDYIQRKQPYPLNLALTMTEGQVEDFIGSWDDSEEGGFNAGSPADWQKIFDIP